MPCPAISRASAHRSSLGVDGHAAGQAAAKPSASRTGAPLGHARLRRPCAPGARYLLALWLCCACRAAPTNKPFARETVVQDLSQRYPGVSLPKDELPPGVVAHEAIAYALRAAHPLELDVYQPEAAGMHPALIVVHGGGWESGDRKMERPMAKRLAGLGYVAVPVSYRLEAAGRFPNALYDLKSAVRYLRSNAARYAIDPEHIGAVGGSAGGQLVALLGASNEQADFEGERADASVSSRVQAVVDIDGLADFTGPALVAKERNNPGATTRFLGGSYAQRGSVWRAASALSHVGPKSAPTLFIESTAPTPILPGRPEMAAALSALGIASQVAVLPDTPHPFWLVNPWFEPTLALADRFLRAHL